MVEDKTQIVGVHAGNSRLRLATDQISSLIVLSHSIKVFSSRWKLIRNKLNEILPLLPPEIQDSGDGPSFSGVIQAIEETTEFTTKLAQKCIDFSYSGKLLMQSDLDIICVKFNNHIKSLSELSSIDAFSSNGQYAIVVSRPGPTASRDDIRFYFKDLLSRFKIGNSEMKEQALICFNEVIQEDNRCVKTAMEIDGLVFVLVEFLGSKEVGIQEEALKSLDMICRFHSYKGVLASIGIVAPLIRALEGGSHLSKKLSTRCLMKVTADSDNAWAVSAHGGVTALLRISASESENGAELVSLACGVLKNLVGVEEIKRFIVEEGTIPMFINLVKSINEVTQISAIDFLRSIASGDELVANLIANEGGIRVLVRVLDPKSSFSSKTKEMSIMAIMSLCSNPTRLNNLVSYGFMDHILHLLRDGEVSVQESCLKAAFWLSGTSDEFKKAMGDAGFMPELIKFVAAKSFEVREMASETLSSLVSIPRNRKRFVENDQNVSLLLQSIDPEEGTSGNRKLLLPIIMSLSGCNSGRKKILGSGYLKNIEKLADEQVSDAKKIVRNLSSNRLVRLIRGIWR
ncbi:uncharacterized protein LOC112519142 [Cynara cardunculus var. scolymus]|uniref:Armadillo n=1 Tax=Cynara cardunculus var. scolymus TaxID=59895 RepID=A0A103Y1Z4_CYNCS|nr:uncharacterized protein LOC112519142 [Cynara cardunculus var. scolymus]KVI01043.1 Armadillo [Cynara cardunculus var. scolymus]